MKEAKEKEKEAGMTKKDIMKIAAIILFILAGAIVFIGLCLIPDCNEYYFTEGWKDGVGDFAPYEFLRSDTMKVIYINDDKSNSVNTNNP